MQCRLSLIAAACAALWFAQGAQAQPSPGSCAAKQADIQHDIDAAKPKGQARRVRGLETAMRETQAHCSDAKLHKEYEARIARQEKKVAERQKDLAQAQAQGKADKIANREAKLAQEQATLDRLRATGH